MKIQLSKSEALNRVQFIKVNKHCFRSLCKKLDYQEKKELFLQNNFKMPGGSAPSNPNVPTGFSVGSQKLPSLDDDDEKNQPVSYF